MNAIKSFLSSLMFLILVACTTINENDSLNNEVHEITKKLDAIFFKEFCPKNITVKYAKLSNFGSIFDTNTNVITLSQNYLTHKTREERPIYEYKNKNELLVHEMCHLALYNLTNHQSIKENFRFLDEGLAEIIGRQIAQPNELEMYKIKSIQIAKAQVLNVSFKRIQKWDDFFGTFDSPQKNWFAYDVGASFIFFIFDKYSKEKLYELFISISKTEDFSKSIHDVFGKEAAELENEWRNYIIDQSQKSHSPPNYKLNIAQSN